MARPCECCAHRSKADINRALINGGRIIQLARKYGISESAVKRHRKNHVNLETVSRPAIDARDRSDFEVWSKQAKLETPDDVLNFSKWLLWRIERLVGTAEQDGDVRTAISGLTSMQRTLESLFAKTTGLLVRDAPESGASRVAVVLRTVTEEELRAFLVGHSQKRAELPS